MNSKRPLWQFATDGLAGLIVAIIGFGIFWVSLGSRMGIFFHQGTGLNDLVRFYGLMFSSQDSFISPMPSIIWIGFSSMGIGGWFLENITSRRSWVKPILMISFISWLSGIGLLPILFNEIGWGWSLVGITSISAGVGFLLAASAGILFNPAKRWLRLIIGTIASTVVGCGVGFWIYIFQIP